MRPSLALAVACSLTLSVGPVSAQKDKEKEQKELADKALGVLRKHCASCHDAPSGKGGISYILDVPKLLQNKVVLRGDPKGSRPVIRMREAPESGMPPEEVTARPTEAEIGLVEDWIRAGAPAPGGAIRAVEEPPPGRPKKGTPDLLRAIHTDLNTKVLEENRTYQRYFTLLNVYNTPGVTDKDLQVYRAALAKVLNSLSWRADIVTPRVVDAEGLVLAIDSRDLDWDRHGLWDAVLRAYPYGLTYHEVPDDRALNDLSKQITQLMGEKRAPSLAHVRADWFIATATRPPLYHTLLYDKALPELVRRDTARHKDFNSSDPEKADFNPKGMTAFDLEERLGVSVADNFQRGVAKRAAFTVSGVSKQNRMVERHPSNYGAYWKSYDFKPVADNARGTLAQLPLGPSEFLVRDPRNGGRDIVTRPSAYPELAFAHDGGEVIFNLPNGLQGYLLLNGKDQRIDVGPSAVVFDVKNATGDVNITNGISCMTCHARGMKSGFKDEVAGGVLNVGGKNLAKVRQLYVNSLEMNLFVQRDEKRYLTAIEGLDKLFLTGSGFEQVETVTRVAKAYLTQPLSATTVAIELGLFDRDNKPDVATVKATIKTAIKAGKLQNLGLGRLVDDNGVIPRADWEVQKDRAQSLFQQVAAVAGVGTPH